MRNEEQMSSVFQMKAACQIISLLELQMLIFPIEERCIQLDN